MIQTELMAQETNNKKQKPHTLHWQFLRPMGQRSDGWYFTGKKGIQRKGKYMVN